MSSVAVKGPDIAGGIVDSVIVNRVRVLVRRLVLHPLGLRDSLDDRTIKSGPFILLADSTGVRVVASVNLPAGDYDKLKFEIHRFSSSEVPSYRNDTTFGDFVTDDRYSVIIDGYAVRQGTVRPFTYRSDGTSNVMLQSTKMVIPSSGMYTASLVFSVAAAFRAGSNYLDPDDRTNESQIDNNIRSAFRLNP
ncbi:MAG: hypothetical protein ACK47W_05900 [Bacteroidota bacterium]